MPPNQQNLDASAAHMFKFGEKTWDFSTCAPVVMGIVNVTPDSFSDGGAHIAPERAVEHALEMIAAGAGMIDIGGESTRPGAPEVENTEEQHRVVPVIRALSRQTTVPISVDTRKATVAAAALDAGATIVNDISGLHYDPNMLPLLCDNNAGCIVMHMRGTPATMQQMTGYTDLIAEICQYFDAIIKHAQGCGIEPTRLVLDPGLGFGKTWEQNLMLLADLHQFRELGRPLLVGPSRKSFIGHILQQSDPTKRMWGTAAAVTACILHGASIVRVHDVAEMADVVKVSTAIAQPRHG